jgi:hypothetical protein
MKKYLLAPYYLYQRLLPIPTAPSEIRRRAAKIRQRLARERQKMHERRQLQEDLKLIKFDRMIRKAKR